MSVDLVMRAIAEHWDSVESHLTAQAARRFRAFVGQFTTAGATADDRLDAADELTDLLAAALPADHPVRRAIADPFSARSGQAVVAAQDEELIEELRRLLEPELHALLGTSVSWPPEEIAQDTMGRLLAAPALSATDLRRRGGDPDQEHLIRLHDRDGLRFPVFQFDGAGRPLRLVLDINALLDADADPWGVADWWLGRNSWLSRTPAESLGLIADEVLLATALALVEAGC
jgi:hypothetical protein